MKQIFLALILISSAAMAAPVAKKKNNSAQQPSSDATITQPAPAPPPAARERAYWQMALNLLLSQEYIKATRAPDTQQLLVQSQGVGLDFDRRIPTSNIRWWQSHTLQLSMGVIHTSGQQGTTIPDTLRQQPFYGATYAPGFIYRTTANSEFGFNLPLEYRMISWSADDPTLKIDRKTSFSWGGSLVYLLRTSRQGSLQVKMTDHASWKAFEWSLGYAHSFR